MRKRVLYKVLLLFAMCFLLASCGGKEQQEETDAYVYVARQVSVPAKDQYGNQPVQDLKAANGYLYYLYDEKARGKSWTMIFPFQNWEKHHPMACMF